MPALYVYFKLNIKVQKLLKNTLFIVSLAGLLSCQKKTVAPVVPDEVKISITSPQEGQVYKQGDTVFIKGNISYTSQLHGYITRIKGEAGEIIYETEGHTHGDNIAIAEQWVNTLNTPSKLTLELITVINHNEDKKSINVGFSSQP